MANLTKSIRKYLDEVITLSQEDIQSAAKSREWFLDRVESEIAARSREPILYSKCPFVYFGSYFKYTKVADVDEFDVLVVIDSNLGQFTQSDTVIGSGIGTADPNHRYDGKYKKSDGSGVSPTKMLNWLKEVVEKVVDGFGGEAPERSGQAVTAIIKSKSLKIDLVPAGIFTRKSDSMTFYDIPKGDKNNGWILTSPQVDIDRLADVAKGKDDFRNVIRIAKRIKDKYNFLVSSFAVETAITEYGENRYWRNDLAKDVKEALAYLSTRFREGRISDPFDPDNNLISGVESLDWYADRLDGIVDAISQLEDKPIQEDADNSVMSVFENEQ